MLFPSTCVINNNNVGLSHLAKKAISSPWIGVCEGDIGAGLVAFQPDGTTQIRLHGHMHMQIYTLNVTNQKQTETIFLASKIIDKAPEIASRSNGVFARFNRASEGAFNKCCINSAQGHGRLPLLKVFLAFFFICLIFLPCCQILINVRYFANFGDRIFFQSQPGCDLNKANPNLANKKDRSSLEKLEEEAVELWDQTGQKKDHFFTLAHRKNAAEKWCVKCN